MSVPPSKPEFGPTGVDPGTAPPWADQQTQAIVLPPPAIAPAGWAVEPPRSTNFWPVMVALGAGSLVAVAIGVYGGLHDPTGQAFNLAGFSSGSHAKSWLASLAFALAIAQVISAMAIWGRLPGTRGGGAVAGAVHRWSGRLAVLVSLPVAAHCLYAFGFQGFDTRVLVHSLLGCFFYGIFVCKMIVLNRRDTPSWVLPVAGGLLFTGLAGLWLTSSLWFFTQFGLSL